MTPKSEILLRDALLDRLSKLTLEESAKTAIPPFDGELKSILKDVSKLDFYKDQTISKKISEIIILVLKANTNVDNSDSLQISNALQIIKSLAETPVIVLNTKEPRKDPFWTEIILPNLQEIYNFLNNVVFTYCAKTLKETASKCTTTEGSSSSGGFAHHQLLGLLQKGLRTLIVFLKRGVLNPETWTDSVNDVIISCINKIGNLLCDFLENSVDVGLDIRCNIGLAFSNIAFHLLRGDKNGVVRYFEAIFALTADPSNAQNNNNELLIKIYQLSRKDVNRIGIAIGVLASMNFEDEEVSSSTLIYSIAQNILEIDFGTKETINLGCGRVLENWTEKISSPSISLETLESISPLFGALEFFAFTYMPGHIDAVKQCCRNILGGLTRIYHRIDENNNSSSMIEELVRKTLSKPPHVIWFAFASITKNSSKSVVVVKIAQDIPTRLLCVERTIKNSTNETYVALMAYEFPNLPLRVWEDRWIKPLFTAQTFPNSESNWPQKRIIITTILNSEKRYPEIKFMINPLLKFVIDKMNSKTEVDNNSDEDGIAASALLATETIKIASELGVKIDITNNSISAEDSFRGLIPRSTLHSWLWNENPQIRLAGFSLLVETRKTSELITYEDFESIKILFKYNLASQNPAFRQQFLAYFKKLVTRLKDSYALVKRKKDVTNCQNYDAFFCWLWKFLTEEEGLYVGANFGRRYQALYCLSEMMIVFDNVSIFGVKPDNANMKYLRWLTDSYENNKIRALQILEKIPMPFFEDLETCEKIFQEALNYCESIKPPESVSGRYLMLLLMKKCSSKMEKYTAINILNALFSKLEETYLKIKSTSLTQVSSETPMYGLIRCIWVVLSSNDDYLKNPEIFKDYFSKLLDLCLKYDEILFPVLGNAAPEGFLPGLPETSEGSNQVVRSIAAQMLLVCSWRSMRDICLMLADLCSVFPLEGEKRIARKNPDGIYILTCDQVSIIGDHLLYLLKNLMHRGVFEQVYVGFKTLASRLWRSSNPKLSSLPEQWLKEAMDEEHMSSKCITRRSGGLPFIFQALLAAEKDNEALLSNWVQRLFVKDESVESSSIRIHAMNVIRGLFKNGDFSGPMMPYVPEGLRLAFRGLKSLNWTERNSGLMLYGAIMRRTFGAKLNLMSAPTFFRKFPSMYDFLLGELVICIDNLKKGNENAKTEKESDFTFHLLLLLSSFALVERVEDDHFKLSEFIPKLKECAASPDMEVRKLAAKGLLPFLISPEDKTNQVLEILNYLKESNISKFSLNLLHGTLTQVAAILPYISQDKDTIEKIIQALGDVLSTPYFWTIKCPTIYETLAQILITINKFKNPDVAKIYRKLEETFYKTFDNRVIKYRNSIPGLPIADACLSKTKILFTLAISESESAARQMIYNWFSDMDSSAIFIEQLVEHLCDKSNSAVVEIVFNQNCETEGAVLLECLVSRYMSQEIKHIGQSVVESKFLELLTLVNNKTFDSWVNSPEAEDLVQKLLNRLVIICDGETATTIHKHSALRVISQIAFGTEIGLSSPEHQNMLCKTLVEWSNSTMDDDLRHAAALSIPEIPFENRTKFSVIEKCQIWLAIVKLVQDDDEEVRKVINSKLSRGDSEKVYCDRKSLEKLVAIYFQNMVEPCPLEGFALLLGIIFRDDYEIKPDEADDDEERLFEKSEMNLFNEPVIFTRTVLEYLKTLPSDKRKSYKEYFNSCLGLELVELYELASNSKLFFCNITIQSIIDVLEKKINASDNDITTNQVICISPGSETTRTVQSTIMNTVLQFFV